MKLEPMTVESWRATRVVLVLLCAGLPAGASLAQQLPVPELPTDALEPVLEQPLQSSENEKQPQRPTGQEGSGGTAANAQSHGRVQGKGNQTESNVSADGASVEATDAHIDDQNRSPGESVPSGTETASEQPASAHAKAPGSKTTPDKPEPDAKDFARAGGGSLLDQPSSAFSRNRKHGLSASRSRVVDDLDHEPCEVLVMSKTMDEAEAMRRTLAADAMRIERRYDLTQLGFVLSVFCVTDEANTELAVEALRRRHPSTTAGLNHRYETAAGQQYYAKAVGWRNELRACAADRRIGLVDTGVDAGHPAFRGSKLVTRSLLPAGTRPADDEHGTAVASVLTGTAGELPGLVNAAELVAVNVFRRRSDDSMDTNAELLVRAIDWLLGERVELINMSLEGPPNELLEHAVRMAADSGVLVVAAGGNGDRNPAYPAAYPSVVAVTAVDASARVYPRANRGDYIELAAPGVDLYLAAPGERRKYFSGTSFAAPFVTAALAMLKSAHPDWPAARLHRHLASLAVDLGEQGPDPVFGRGLVQVPADCGAVAATE